MKFYNYILSFKKSIFLLCLFFCLLSSAHFYGQTTLWSTDFETGNTIPTYNLTTGLSLGLSATGGNTAPNCGRIIANSGGAGKVYNGSIITNSSITFTTGKYYEVTVWAKAATAAGRLRIMKSLTATNAAMNAATGTDIILNSATLNVNSISYVKYAASFTVATNETKFIGFQMYQDATASASMFLDDITIIEYNIPPCSYYCSPTPGTSTAAGTITNVTFPSSGGINRTSSETGYLCTGQSATVVQDNTYTLSISKTTSLSCAIAAYIDFNADGDFEDAGENIMLNAPNTTATQTANVTIPNTSVLGTTKMRVFFKYSTAITGPCDATATSYNDIEDYDLIIQPSTSCSGTPNPGNLIASSSISCASAGISSVVSLATVLTQSGFTYQWQSSATSGGAYANVSGETNDSIFVLLPSADTYYRLAVTCANSGITANSNTIVVNFCPPSCNDYIQNGTETGIDCGGSCPACSVPANDCANHPLLISQCSQSFSITQAQMAAATNDVNCTSGGSCPVAAGVYNNFDCDNTVFSGGTLGNDFDGANENSLFWTFTPTTSCSYNISITATNCCCKSGGPTDAAQYYVYRTSDRLPNGTILQYYGGFTGGFTGARSLSINSVAYQPILIVVDGYNDSDCDIAIQITAGGSCDCRIAPLPIELFSFYAKKQNKDIKISWTTVSELNNSHFNLMRLNEETSNWEKIAKLNGKGNSNALQYYNFVDTDVKEKTYYYQLEQVNFDGNVSRSKIISINNTIDQGAEFKLIPNPVESEKTCQVVLNTLPEKELIIQVIDINGVVKYESKIFPENSTIEIPTNFTSGIYLVKLSCNEFTQTKRLMVK